MSMFDASRPQPATRAEAAGGRGRNQALEGLRGAVVLLTMLFHAWQFGGGQVDYFQPGAMAAVARTGGWVVSFFFVMTGVLVYGRYCRAVLDGRDPGPAGQNLLRRLLRVLPVYWVVLLIVWAARNPGFPGDLRDLAEHATLTMVFDRTRIFWTIGPAWSLAAQVALYLLLALLWRPVATLAAPRTRAGRVSLLMLVPAALVVGGSAYLAVASVVLDAAADNWPVWFNPLAQAPALGLGTAIALWHAVRPVRLTSRLARALAPAVCLAALALMALAAQESGGGTGGMILFRMIASACFAVLIVTALGLPADAWWSRLCAWPPLVWVGTISFSVYLWHEPALLLASSLGAVHPDDPQVWLVGVQWAVGIAAGWLGYRLLEAPMQRLTDVVAPRHALPRRYDVAARRRTPSSQPGAR